MDVPVPKLVPANVGMFPAGDVLAPENVSVCGLANDVATLRYVSYEVIVIVCPLPAVCVLLPVILNAAAVACDTRTVNLSLPAALIEPSVTAISTVSALYNSSVLVPVETPFVNVIVVLPPKLTSFTCGTLIVSGAVFAPLNTIVVLLPV